MIEEATVDAYGESELASGWFTMLEEYLEIPFAAKVLGIDITVARIAIRDDGRIVAICMRGRDRQRMMEPWTIRPTLSSQ